MENVTREEPRGTSNSQHLTANGEGITELSRTRTRTTTRTSELGRDRREARNEMLAEGEQKFTEALIKFTAGAKKSREPAVAVAARRWEGKIHFQITIAKQRRERRRENGRVGKWGPKTEDRGLKT